MSKVKCIGIISEDESDFESSKTIIKRIIPKSDISFKKAIGNGCGKIRRKALAYTIDLKKRGCDTVILIHDLDRQDFEKLKSELHIKLTECPLANKLICIPVEEIEAWFLSDPDGIKKTFNLKRKPKVKGNPETIISPKEKLGELIYHCSEKNIHYLNTKHNQLLSSIVSIELMRQKCKSFEHFYSFVSTQKY